MFKRLLSLVKSVRRFLSNPFLYLLFFSLWAFPTLSFCTTHSTLFQHLSLGLLYTFCFSLSRPSLHISTHFNTFQHLPTPSNTFQHHPTPSNTFQHLPTPFNTNHSLFSTFQLFSHQAFSKCQKQNGRKGMEKAKEGVRR